MVLRVLRTNLLSRSRDGRSEGGSPMGEFPARAVARARGSRYGARPVPEPMRRLPRVLPTAALAITLIALGTLAPAAGAQAPRLTSCPDQSAFGCGSITVPLDYSGRVPGTVSLRFAARRTFPRTGKVLFALTGGPGQQGIDFATPSALSLSPALRQYRIVTLDQRGTGKSGVLRCPSLQSSRALDVVAPTALAACAARIGPRRQFYTSADTVLDLESLRKSLGATKVALMGISYGTHVALQYARAFPQNVDRLLLDSIVGPNGPDAFLLDTYRTLPRILREQCANNRCAAPTRDPAAPAAPARRGPRSPGWARSSPPSTRGGRCAGRSSPRPAAVSARRTPLPSSS